MEKITSDTKDKTVSQHHSHCEDASLKLMMQFFADELLPLLGIDGNVVSIAPTEFIHLELKNLLEDFNLIMGDGTWKHFEFQSKNGGIKDLKRFRSYEAVTSYTYDISVTTYVLYSGHIKNPITEYTEGINTYRVIPIIMQEKSADQFFDELQKKRENGKLITRSDLVMLTLCPLMGGEISMKDRIIKAYQYTKEAADIAPEDIQKIEAVIYAMAEKFLKSMEIEEVKEAMLMTRIGEMLIDEGRKQGAQAEQLTIAENLLDILDIHTIAERVGLSVEIVQKIKEEKKSK